jgi:hypothetical protein
VIRSGVTFPRVHTSNLSIAGARGKLISPRHTVANLIDPIGQIIFLLRFFCFMAVFYLALHKLVAHLSRKSGSKLLWFFSVVTAPLIRPVKKWSSPDTADDRIISAALVFYGLLWLLLIFAGRFWSR